MTIRTLEEARIEATKNGHIMSVVEKEGNGVILIECINCKAALIKVSKDIIGSALTMRCLKEKRG